MLNEWGWERGDCVAILAQGALACLARFAIEAILGAACLARFAIEAIEAWARFAIEAIEAWARLVWRASR